MAQSLNLFISSPNPTFQENPISKNPIFTFNPRLSFPKTHLARPIKALSSDHTPATLANGVISVDSTSIEVDSVTETELKENGFRSTRRTKLVCTIGPATCGFEQLEALAVGGMNVARINMCHGTRDWHKRVIERVRKLNEDKGYAVAIMMDTEGSEIHMGDLGGAPSAKAEVFVYFNSMAES